MRFLLLSESLLNHMFVKPNSVLFLFTTTVAVSHFRPAYSLGLTFGEIVPLELEVFMKHITQFSQNA